MLIYHDDHSAPFDCPNLVTVAWVGENIGSLYRLNVRVRLVL